MKKLLIFCLILGLSVSAFSATKGSAPKHIVFKGLNTKAGPLQLDDGESPDCRNVHTNIFGTLIKRKGYDNLNSVVNAHPAANPNGNGLFDFAVDTVTRKLVGYFSNTFQKMDDLDGTWDVIPVGDNLILTDDIASFENNDGICLMLTWSRDTMVSWNGTDATLTHVTAAPAGKYIIKAYSRFFISGLEDSPLRFDFSAVDSHTTWDDTVDFETLDARDGDQAMGWGLLRGSLYGFTRNTVNLISAFGGNPLFQPRRLLDGVGLGAPRSVQTVNIPNFGEAMIWLTNDKRLVQWNGSSMVEVSEKVSVNNGQSPFSMEEITQAQLEKSHAVVLREKGWYILFTAIGASIDQALVYDYKTGTLWPFDNQTFRSSALVDTSTGNRIFTQDDTGFAYEWDVNNDDNGDTINGSWTSRKFDYGWMPIIKKPGKVGILTKTIGNFDLNFQYRHNWDTSWSTAIPLKMFKNEWLLGDNLPAILGGGQANFHQVSMPAAFNLFQIRLINNTTNPAFEVLSLDLLANPTGVFSD